MNSTLPLYRKIASEMKHRIESGQWKKGEAIPTENRLVDEFNTSRVTIRKAIDVLQQEGLLYKIQGSGTYVKEKKFEHNLYTLKSFTEEMKIEGRSIHSNIIEFSMQSAGKSIANQLNIQPDEKVFFVRRQRMVDDVPLVVEDTYLPVNMFPDLSVEVMKGSKYEYIEREKKLKIKESFQEFIPILPDDEIKRLLHLEKDIPILKVALYSLLENNTPFEYTELYFKSDEYRFTIRAGRQ